MNAVKGKFYESLFFQLVIDNEIYIPVYRDKNEIRIGTIKTLRVNDLPDLDSYEELMELKKYIDEQSKLSIVNTSSGNIGNEDSSTSTETNESSVISQASNDKPIIPTSHHSRSNSWKIQDINDNLSYYLDQINLLQSTLKIFHTDLYSIGNRWSEIYSQYIAETYEDQKVLISHVDLDGYGSIILGLLTSQFDVIFTCTRQAFTDTFKLQLSRAEVIYICDLCPPESWFDMKNLHVYDHHPNSSPLLKQPSIAKRIFIDTSRCGTRLFYEEQAKPILEVLITKSKPIPAISTLWKNYKTNDFNLKTIDDFVYLVDTFDRWLNDTPDFSIAIDLQKAFLSSLNEFNPHYRSIILINQHVTNHGRKFIMWLINKLTSENFRTIDSTWKYHLDQVDDLIIRRYKHISKDLERNKLQIRLDEDGHKYIIFNKVTIYDHTFVTHYLLEHMDIDYVICNYGDQPMDKRIGSARSISFDLTQLKRYMGGHEHACRVSTGDIDI